MKNCENQLIVEIDPGSGFCFGVDEAIKLAENELQHESSLFCLGEMVHNAEEVKRLENLGLKTIEKADFEKLSNTKVFVRAHGEPPSTYETARHRNIQLIDGTCPIVLNLQQRVKKAGKEALQRNGQVVIFGKKDHAEVIGLLGQTDGNGIVVSGITDIEAIDFERPVVLFSQTTQNPYRYAEIADAIKQRMTEKGTDNLFVRKNTICGQVANRDKELRRFASRHSCIIFVSGRNSSNGQTLFSVCRTANANSFFVSKPEEIEHHWLKHAHSVGICGATSTPRHQMQAVAQQVIHLVKTAT